MYFADSPIEEGPGPAHVSKDCVSIPDRYPLNLENDPLVALIPDYTGALILADPREGAWVLRPGREHELVWAEQLEFTTFQRRRPKHILPVDSDGEGLVVRNAVGEEFSYFVAERALR